MLARSRGLWMHCMTSSKARDIEHGRRFTSQLWRNTSTFVSSSRRATLPKKACTSTKTYANRYSIVCSHVTLFHCFQYQIVSELLTVLSLMHFSFCSFYKGSYCKTSSQVWNINWVSNKSRVSSWSRMPPYDAMIDVIARGNNWQNKKYR